MYRAVTIVAGVAFSIVGLLLAGWGPSLIISATTYQESLPAVEAGNLLWSALATVRVLGFVLFGVGLCSISARQLKSAEAQAFALRSIGVVSGCGLCMAIIQVLTVIAVPAGWALVAVFAAVLSASLLATREPLSATAS